MPKPLFRRFVNRMPAVRAERMMDAARASLYPQLTQAGAQRLWASWVEQARGGDIASQQKAADEAGALFTWNGAPLTSAKALRSKASEYLGSMVRAA